ncbi:MAG TPA: sensor domain-containing diguanylate cyclase [Planococcus sp. (in: firmicutes)]|nr:sensor domain-containing diguanylate cyclase [Planococcus sp. (in: firmicutes)]
MSGSETLPFERVLMDGIQELVFVVRICDDSDPVYEFINKAALERLGLSKSVFEKALHEVNAAETADRVHAYIKKVANSGKPFSYEAHFLTPLGEKFHSKTELTPIFDDNGTCTHVVILVKDISNEKVAKLEIKEALSRLEESRLRYQSLYENNSDAILAMDLDGKIMDANNAAVMLSDLSVCELVGTRYTDYLKESEKEQAKLYFQYSLHGSFNEYRFNFLSKEGRETNCIIKYSPIEAEGEIIGVYAIIKNMSAIDTLVNKYLESEKRFRIIAENAHDVIFLMNEEKEYVYVSPSCKGIYGYEPSDYLEKPTFHMIHPEDQQVMENVMEESISEGKPSKLRIRIRHQTKDWTWTDLHATPVYDDKKCFSHMVFIGRDITVQREYEMQLEKYAYHDSLTELPNRRFFKEALKKQLDKAKHHQLALAVLLLDIDEFKEINDRWGHGVGDYVIREFGKRLAETVANNGMAARLGGDEFVVLLPNVLTQEDAIRAAQRIMLNMKKPWKLADASVNVTASIGIALTEVGEATASNMLKTADGAMYEAKQSGGNCFQLNLI